MIKKVLRILTTIIAVVFLIIFILPISYHIINIGNLFGIILCVYLIFWCGFNGTYKRIKAKLCRNKVVKVLWKIFNICATVFVCYAIIISGVMIGTSLIKPEQDASVIILGAKVNPNGASVVLRQRMDAGKEYLENNDNTIAVASGGQGNDEPMSEAQCMYEYLTANGISADRIIVEDKSTNTYQNISNSYDLIIANGQSESLAIATDSYHQFRARLIARKQGIKTSIGAVNSHTTDNLTAVLCYPIYFVREWFAIPVEILK